MNANRNPLAVMDDLSAVLEKHGASLFFGAPAMLWIQGEEICEVWHDENDGGRIEPVDPAALARFEVQS
jgi:hypothetical protein